MVLSGSKESTTLKGILIRAISRERASTERRYSWQENHSLRWCKRLADGVCAHAPLSFARLLSPSNLTRCLSHCERQGRQVALTGHKKRTQTSFSKRLGNRVQITSDGHRAYLEAVEAAFGVDVGYAQLIISMAKFRIPQAGIARRKSMAPKPCAARAIRTRRTFQPVTSSAKI